MGENRARRRPQRSFTPAFRAEVVALVRQGDRIVPAVWLELDLSETAGRPCMAKAAVDPGERDILKRSATYFTMETR